MKNVLKNNNIYLIIGAIIYLGAIVIDRFVSPIPDLLYIFIMIVVIVLFMINIILNNKK